MPLNGMTLMKGSTGVTIVGGTSTAYDTDAIDVKNGIHVVDNTEANFLLRQHLTYKNKPHAQRPDGTYSRGVRNVVLTIPILLASGKVDYNICRIQLEIVPESTAAQIGELRRQGVQSIIDPDTDNFVLYGATK